MAEPKVFERRPILWEGTHKNETWEKEHLKKIVENTPEEVRLFLGHDETEQTLIGIAKNFIYEEKEGKGVILADLVIADPLIADKVEALQKAETDSYEISPAIVWKDEEKQTARFKHVALVLHGAQGDMAKLSATPDLNELAAELNTLLSSESLDENVKELLSTIKGLLETLAKYPYPKTPGYPKPDAQYPAPKSSYPYPYPYPYPAPKGQGVFKKDLAELIAALEKCKNIDEVKEVVKKIKALLEKYGVKASSTNSVAWALQSPSTEALQVDKAKYKKELFRTGNFIISDRSRKDLPPLYLEVTKDRLERWIENTKKHLPKIPVFIGHPDPGKEEIDKVVGWLDAESLEIKEGTIGHSLWGNIEIINPLVREAIDNKQIRFVSIALDFDHVDLEGNECGEVLTHIALTTFPKLKIQSDFERLAASELPSVVEAEVKEAPSMSNSEEVEKLKSRVSEFKRKVELLQRAYEQTTARLRKERLSAFRNELVALGVPPAAQERFLNVARVLIEQDRFEDVDSLLEGIKGANFSEVGRPDEDVTPQAEEQTSASFVDAPLNDIERLLKEKGLL